MISKKLIFLALTAFTIAINSRAMEDRDTIPPCNLKDKIKLSVLFSFKGAFLSDREALLQVLVIKNDPKDLALMQSLLCSNTSWFTNSYVEADTNGLIGYKLLMEAIKKNNKPFIKTFFKYLDFSEGFPAKSRFDNEYKVGGNEFNKLYNKINSALK